MKDTHFYLDDTKGGSLTAQYTSGEDNKITPQDLGDEESRWITSERSIFSGPVIWSQQLGTISVFNR